MSCREGLEPKATAYGLGLLLFIPVYLDTAAKRGNARGWDVAQC